MKSNLPVVVVEDDPWTRLIGVVLDPTTSEERRAAFADFMSPDEPDFARWCDDLRARAGGLYPSEVRLVPSQAELCVVLPSACALIVESFAVGTDELRCAPQLKVVQKYGALLRNIDVPACTAAGIKVLGVRRRANIACAEHAFALMLTLARRIHRFNGVTSIEKLSAAKIPYKPFDRRHVPNGNWGRVTGTRSLHGSTIGIIGLGEIGREIALRAAAFGMDSCISSARGCRRAKKRLSACPIGPLHDLLAQSDWVVPQLPTDPSTRHFIDRERLALMKPGACLINVSRAEAVANSHRSAPLGSSRRVRARPAL